MGIGMFIAHSESPEVEMSAVGVGEGQHLQECPCALHKGGAVCCVPPQLCSSPAPPPAAAYRGHGDEHRARGEGAQGLSCSRGSALDEEWDCSCPVACLYVSGEPRAPRCL